MANSTRALQAPRALQGSRWRSAEFERAPHHPLDRRPLGVGRRPEGDRPHVLSRTLEEPTPVVELPAAVEKQVGVVRKRADANHVGAIDRVSSDLPHVSAGARRLAPVGDLLGPRRSGSNHRTGRLQHRTDRRGDLFQLLGHSHFSGVGHPHTDSD